MHSLHLASPPTNRPTYQPTAGSTNCQVERTKEEAEEVAATEKAEKEKQDKEKEKAEKDKARVGACVVCDAPPVVCASILQHKHAVMNHSSIPQPQ